MNIRAEVINHNEQRYNTIGDWFYTESSIVIKISRIGDWRMEFAIAIHELIEATLCLKDGVTEESVTKFDLAFEKKPYNAQYDGDSSEAGDSPKAPYQRQHCFATGVERMIIALLGVKWKDYEDRIEEVSSTYGERRVGKSTESRG